jgi:hypothetical protein
VKEGGLCAQLPRDVGEDDLIPVFKDYGCIVEVHVMRDRYTRQSKGWRIIGCTFRACVCLYIRACEHNFICAYTCTCVYGEYMFTVDECTARTGSAFIKFATIGEANACISALNNAKVFDQSKQPLEVRLASGEEARLGALRVSSSL